MIRGFFYKFNRNFQNLKNVIFHVKLLSPTLNINFGKRQVGFCTIFAHDPAELFFESSFATGVICTLILVLTKTDVKVS